MELRLGAVAREGLHEVLELHLQHHVHTALEVKAEVDFFRTYILVLIAEINLLIGNGVSVPFLLLFLDGVKIVGRFVLHRDNCLFGILFGFPALKG